MCYKTFDLFISECHKFKYENNIFNHIEPTVLSQISKLEYLTSTIQRLKYFYVLRMAIILV